MGGHWQVEGGWGVERLRWVEAAAPPPPGPGEVRLRISAMSLNFRDLLMIRGRYNPQQPLPLIPGSDGVGRIEAIGPGVHGWALGDRAVAPFCPGWRGGALPPDATRHTLGGPLPGMLQTWRCLPADALLRPPAHLDDAEVAALPCAAVTAWHALFAAGHLQPGQRLLTIGTGGVSLFAVQLALMAGARPLVVTRRPEKAAAVAALGAEVIVSTGGGWGREARTRSEGGVDLVVEVGGAGTLTESLAATRPGGTIAIIGVLDGVEATLPLTSVLMRGLRLQGVFVGSRDHHAALHAALAAHPTVRPVIGGRFALAELPQALAALSAGDHMGKLILDAAIS